MKLYLTLHSVLSITFILIVRIQYTYSDYCIRTNSDRWRHNYQYVEWLW